MNGFRDELSAHILGAKDRLARFWFEAIEPERLVLFQRVFAFTFLFYVIGWGQTATEWLTDNSFHITPAATNPVYPMPFPAIAEAWLVPFLVVLYGAPTLMMLNLGGRPVKLITVALAVYIQLVDQISSFTLNKLFIVFFAVIFLAPSPQPIALSGDSDHEEPPASPGFAQFLRDLPKAAQAWFAPRVLLLLLPVAGIATYLLYKPFGVLWAADRINKTAVREISTVLFWVFLAVLAIAFIAQRPPAPTEDQDDGLGSLRTGLGAGVVVSLAMLLTHWLGASVPPWGYVAGALFVGAAVGLRVRPTAPEGIAARLGLWLALLFLGSMWLFGDHLPDWRWPVGAVAVLVGAVFATRRAPRVGPSPGAKSVMAMSGWPMRMVQVTLMIQYTTAGLCKIFWGDWLYVHDILYGHSAGLYRTEAAAVLIQYLPHVLWIPLSYSALAFELFALVIFVPKKLRPWAALFGVVFHMTIAVLMKDLIYFSNQMCVFYIMFLPARWVIPFERAIARRLPGRANRHETTTVFYEPPDEEVVLWFKRKG